MNIISNTCLAGGAYEALNSEFLNPFIWCVIDFNSMYNLIKNYDKINFQNYDLIKEGNWKLSILIDNQVKVSYIHYRFSANDKIPKKHGVDIYYNKIWEYVVEKYETRLKRMLELKEKPMFLIGSVLKEHWFTKNQIQKICELNTPYKIIIANNNYNLGNYKNIKFHIYKKSLSEYRGNNNLLSKEIIEEYKELFV